MTAQEITYRGYRISPEPFGKDGSYRAFIYDETGKCLSGTFCTDLRDAYEEGRRKVDENIKCAEWSAFVAFRNGKAA